MRPNENPPDLIQQILHRINFTEFINQYTLLNSKGYGLCPLHPERNPSFSVNAEKGLWYCFGCQQGGNVFNFVMINEGISFKGALKILAEYLNIPMAKTERDAHTVRKRLHEQKSRRERFTREIAVAELIARKAHESLCKRHRKLFRVQDKSRDHYTQLYNTELQLDLCDQYCRELKEIKYNDKRYI